MIRKLLNRLLGRKVTVGSEAPGTGPIIDAAPQRATDDHEHTWSDYEGTPI